MEPVSDEEGAEVLPQSLVEKLGIYIKRRGIDIIGGEFAMNCVITYLLKHLHFNDKNKAASNIFHGSNQVQKCVTTTLSEVVPEKKWLLPPLTPYPLR